MSLTNVFGECNGFQRVINVIKEQTSGAIFPLSLTGRVLCQFQNLAHFCEKQHTNMFACEVSQTIM